MQGNKMDVSLYYACNRLCKMSKQLYWVARNCAFGFIEHVYIAFVFVVGLCFHIVYGKWKAVLESSSPMGVSLKVSTL